MLLRIYSTLNKDSFVHSFTNYIWLSFALCHVALVKEHILLPLVVVTSLTTNNLLWNHYRKKVRPPINLLFIVIRAHLKQNENNHLISTDYCPSVDNSKNVLKLIKNSLKFCLCSIEKKVGYQLKQHYNFISNNVKGKKASEKRLKLLEYLRNNINNNGFIFLLETHSSSNDE